MSRPSLSTRLGALSGAAVLSLGLVACGGSSGDAEQSSGSGSGSSSAAEESASASEDSGGELQELSAEEFYPTITQALQDAGTASYTMTSTSTAGGQEQTIEMEGDLEYSGSELSMSGQTTSGPKMEVVVLDKVFYLKSPQLGPKWLKVDPEKDPNNPLAPLLGNFDPSKTLEGLGDPKKFTLVGEEDVDGVATNHYKIVLDGAAVAKASGMPAQMQQMVPDEVPAEMWVDAENRPVKFSQEVEIKTPGQGSQTVTSSSEGTYGDFGSDVTIEAPPAGQTTTKLPGMGG